MNTPKKIFFDSSCSLCCSCVNFIRHRDVHEKLIFIPLSDQNNNYVCTDQSCINEDSIIFLNNKKKYIKSTAVIKIVVELGGLWRLIGVFIYFPAYIMVWWR